jgi:hypothetical protein
MKAIADRLKREVAMTDAPTLRKTFDDAHAADHAAHKDEVQKVIGVVKSLGNDFEEVWPKAEPVVVAVANFVRFIPGLASAAPVINALVAVGNALHKADAPSS